MPDKRLIDANALYDTISDVAASTAHDVMSVKNVHECIETAPTIDAVEVVHGRWVFDRPNHYKCSVCDAMWSGVARFMKFCPDCGAKMDAKDMDVHAKEGGAV